MDIIVNASKETERDSSPSTMDSCSRGGKHSQSITSVQISGTSDKFGIIHCKKCGEVFGCDNLTMRRQVEALVESVANFLKLASKA